MIKITCCAIVDDPGIEVTSLTEEEACIVCRLRVMRSSARKMIHDLSVEYAREFPDPEKFAPAT